MVHGRQKETEGQAIKKSSCLSFPSSGITDANHHKELLLKIIMTNNNNNDNHTFFS